MLDHNFSYRKERHGKDEAWNPGNLSSNEQGKYDSHWVQIKTSADNLRRNNIALDQLTNQIHQKRKQHHFPGNCRCHDECRSRAKERTYIRNDIADRYYACQ
ncbi:hypothetical protein D1872_249500 [compost metagenome]